MDGEQKIRAYIGPGRGGLIVGLIALILGAVGAVMMALSAARPVGEPVLFRNRATEARTWCYIDAVGISDWVYRSDDVRYYVAEDAKGNFYVVHLSQSRYNKMTAQQAYWNEETAVQVPERLTGIAHDVTPAIKNNFCKAFDLNVLDFGTYFGTSYLDATSSPRSDSLLGWGILAGFGLLLGLVLTLTSRAANKRTDRALAALGGYAVEQAAAELESPLTLRAPGDRLRLGERYLFGKKTGLALTYDQVIWVYQRVQRTNFIVTGRSLMLADERGELTAAANFGRGGEEQVLELMQRIAAKNPNVLLGFSAENRKAWQALVKAKKGA